MREQRKYFTIGKKTFVVAIGVGSDNLYWHIIPSLVITYDGFWRKFRIGFNFLPIWCNVNVWARCDKNHPKS